MMKCDICGGTLMMQASGIAECELCGMKYSAKCLREKIQGAKDVKPAEKVASSEKEQLLKNAETLMSLKKFDKAQTVYHELTQKYADDYRGWWGKVTSREAYCAKDFVSEDVKIALQLNPMLEEEYISKINGVIESNQFYTHSFSWDCPEEEKAEWPAAMTKAFGILKNAFDAKLQENIAKGKIFATSKNHFLVLPSGHPVRNAYEEGQHYVKRFDVLVRTLRLHDSNYEKAVWTRYGFDVSQFHVLDHHDTECIYFIGNRVGFYSRDYEESDSTLLTVPVDEVLSDLEKVSAQVDSWRAKDRCVECGGKIKLSFFDDDHCKNCGQKYKSLMGGKHHKH